MCALKMSLLSLLFSFIWVSASFKAELILSFFQGRHRYYLVWMKVSLVVGELGWGVGCREADTRFYTRNAGHMLQLCFNVCVCVCKHVYMWSIYVCIYMYIYILRSNTFVPVDFPRLPPHPQYCSEALRCWEVAELASTSLYQLSFWFLLRLSSGQVAVPLGFTSMFSIGLV